MRLSIDYPVDYRNLLRGEYYYPVDEALEQQLSKVAYFVKNPARYGSLPLGTMSLHLCLCWPISGSHSIQTRVITRVHSIGMRYSPPCLSVSFHAHTHAPYGICPFPLLRPEMTPWLEWVWIGNELLFQMRGRLLPSIYLLSPCQTAASISHY